MIADTSVVEAMLKAVGDRLSAAGEACRLVILGGTAMNLHGFVSRPTRDVDVLAQAEGPGGTLRPPDPLPTALKNAIAQVALDFSQPANWMNTAVADQWRAGLPPGLEERLTWRDYGALKIGLVGRKDLIAFKLYASADQVGPGSVHVSDLFALRPTAEDLSEAATWVRTQDTSPEFHAIVEKVVAYVLGRVG